MFGKNRNSLFEKEKVFCIGLNKTGTTSLESALKELGYQLGDQVKGELFLKEFEARNFKPIIDFCHTAEAFQDAPFSFPYLFILLDYFFPNAKFILTVRDSPEQWYDSVVKFHSKLFGNGKLPTREDLMNAGYRYKGFMWDSNRILFNSPENDIYHKPTLIGYYERHNENVRDYFRSNTNFLDLNVSDPGAYQKMCSFLNKNPVGSDFPWLNKS